VPEGITPTFRIVLKVGNGYIRTDARGGSRLSGFGDARSHAINVEEALVLADLPSDSSVKGVSSGYLRYAYRGCPEYFARSLCSPRRNGRKITESNAVLAPL
jgi:hypothetical protein